MNSVKAENTEKREKALVRIRAVDLYDGKYGKEKDKKLAELKEQLSETEFKKLVDEDDYFGKYNNRVLCRNKRTNIHALAESELIRIIRHLEEKQKENSAGSSNAASAGASKDIYTPDLESILIVNVNDMDKYRTIAENEENEGILVLCPIEWDEDKDAETDEETGEKTDKKTYKMRRLKEQDQEFKRLLVSASNVRNKKAVFIRKDLYDTVNEILLCGMKIKDYHKPLAKWNAYYALASTDSFAMKNIPEDIIVVEDYEEGEEGKKGRTVRTRCDIVHTSKNKEGEIVYSLENDKDYDIPINPFDGAGLVSVSMAMKWAEELGAVYCYKNGKETKELPPASFQIRMIPGIKGNLYTFDIKGFAEEKGLLIKDEDGREYYNLDDFEIKKNIKCKTKDRIYADSDLIILTESQVKFLSMYKGGIKGWLEEFQKEIGGYKRTFNISEYSIHQSKVKRCMKTSYQHIQTVNFEDVKGYYHREELDDELYAEGEDDFELYEPTLNAIKRISGSLCEFLKYRLGADVSEDFTDENEDWSWIPPYYKVANILAGNIEEEYVNSKINGKQDADKEKIRKKFKKEIEEEINKKLVPTILDEYFGEKMSEDIERIKNDARSGKLYMEGNYQVLTPDLYALAEYSFGDANPQGLLDGDEVYSDWWNKRHDGQVRELAIIRNPHIYMESRVVPLVRTEYTRKWYQYQKTGILMSSHSAVPYALGTADYDGDTVATTNNTFYIEAVENAIREGNGNTIYHDSKDNDGENGNNHQKTKEDNKNDNNRQENEENAIMKSLMDSDISGYKNNIGEVVNKVTILWNTDRDELIDSKLTEVAKKKNEKIITKKEYEKKVNYAESVGEHPLGQWKYKTEVIGEKIDEDGDVRPIFGIIEEYFEEPWDSSLLDEGEEIAESRKKYEKTKNGETINKLDEIKILSVVGQMVIDAAKTGDKVDIPEDKFFEGFKTYSNKKPQALQYTRKNQSKRGNGFSTGERSNLNYVMRYMNDEINKLEPQDNKKKEKNFDDSKLKKALGIDQVDEKSPLYNALKAPLKNLYGQFAYLTRDTKFRTDNAKKWAFNAFYKYARNVLLSLGGEYASLIGEENEITDGGGCLSVGSVLDSVFTLCYEDGEFNTQSSAKNILWNCFEKELLERARTAKHSEDEDKPLTRAELEKISSKVKKTELPGRPPKLSGLEEKLDALLKKNPIQIQIRQGDVEYLKGLFKEEENEIKAKGKKKRIYERRLLYNQLWVASKCGLTEFESSWVKGQPAIRVGRYLEVLYKEGVSKNTLDSYRTDFNKYVDGHLKEMVEKELLRLDTQKEDTFYIIEDIPNTAGDSSIIIETDDYHKAIEVLAEYMEIPDEIKK